MGFKIPDGYINEQLADYTNRIVYETTLTEATSTITISTDSDGNALSLKAAEMSIYIPTNTDFTAGVTYFGYLALNDKATGYYNHNGDNQTVSIPFAARRLLSSARISMNALGDSVTMESQWLYSDGTTRNKEDYFNVLVGSINKITKFSLSLSSSKTFPIGTTIQIRGIKE